MPKLDLAKFFEAFEPSDLVAAVNAAPVSESFDGENSYNVADTIAFCYNVALKSLIEVGGEFTETLLESIDSSNDLEIVIEECELNGGVLSANVYESNGETYLIVFFIDEEECPAIMAFTTETL